MHRTIRNWEKKGFEWVDLENPTAEDVDALNVRYGVPRTALQDCLHPVHLPQFVAGEKVSQLFLRAFDGSCTRIETVQDVTRKVVAFWGEGFLITVTRKPMAFLSDIQAALSDEVPPDEPLETRSPKELREEILMRIARAVVASFEPGLVEIEEAMDACDHSGEGLDTDREELRLLHRLKRKVTIMRRTLWRTSDVLQQARAGVSDKRQAKWKHLCEQAARMHYFAEELEHGVANVMNLQMSISNLRIAEASHRTNEVMRTLTLFSVVFLPLSFIAGVYGMNFENMPELREPNGYYLALLAMAAIALALVLWFISRGYIRATLKVTALRKKREKAGRTVKAALRAAGAGAPGRKSAHPAMTGTGRDAGAVTGARGK